MKQRYLLLLVLLALLLGSGRLLAGPLSAPSISRWVIGSGGGSVVGGSFSLNGTAGQAAAGVALSGGTYRLTSGFWGEATNANTPSGTRTFLPIMQH